MNFQTRWLDVIDMNKLFNNILKLSWLGITLTIAVIAGPALKNAPASTAIRQDLDFKLVGTAVVDGQEGSMAVVEVEGRHQTTFRSGDSIGSVVIKQILSDRIIVEARDGEKVIKLLHYFKADTPSGSNGTLLNQTIQPLAPRLTGSRSVQIVRLDQRARESLLGEVDKALKEVLVDPVMVYGQPVGVRITPIKPGSIFSEIGLKQGDVILEVKGEEITDPENAIALFDLIDQGGEFDIKVKGRRTRRIHIITE